ncbi:MAG TPA: helix-turn-helix domain-containing protein [Candidatus Thermoplasmatota archaeon]|nr:helix-turn-helix domain-containing protein [Candidatus Thermoplasmatota archaeon]
MRSYLAVLGVVVVLAAAPVVAASPVGELLDELAPDAPGVHEVEALADGAAEAAGLAEPQPGLPVVAVPAEGGFDLPWLAGAGIAVGLAGLAAAGLFFGGARFVTPTEVLQNDVRQRIYAYLKERVGANLKQVTDDLTLTTTNAIWHLRKLEEAGLIHSKRFNGYKVFYPAEGGVEARRMSLGKTALANGNAQEVFEHVVANPGTHQREIARALGVNHGTVRWHLKKLLGAELIVETRRGKASSYEPTPMGLAALREVAARRPVPVAAPAVISAA